MEQLRNSKFSKNAAKESHKRGCYYTTIPHAVKSRDVFGEELTALNLDKVIFCVFPPIHLSGMFRMLYIELC